MALLYQRNEKQTTAKSGLFTSEWVRINTDPYALSDQKSKEIYNDS